MTDPLEDRAAAIEELTVYLDEVGSVEADDRPGEKKGIIDGDPDPTRRRPPPPPWTRSSGCGCWTSRRCSPTPPPPVPWVVEPILARGCVTMLAGREGRGKSMLALALAAARRAGDLLLDIAGMPVGLCGHVLYVDAENGEHEAHRRVHGLSVKAGTLTYVEANGFDLKQHLDELEELVRKHEPKLLVLDSLRSLAPGLDENDSHAGRGRAPADRPPDPAARRSRP